MKVGVVMLVTGALGCAVPDSPPVDAGNADAPGVSLDPTAIRPFTIDVPDDVLVDLRDRIAQTRFPDEIGTDWTYGTDLAYLQELLTYWGDTFDWREEERRLNQFDQYTTRIDGLDIPLHPPALVGGDRAAAAHHSRLALVDRRVREDYRPAHRPGRAWRSRGGCVPRRGAVGPRVWLLGQADRTGVRSRSHR